MATDGDKSLPSENAILDDVDRIALLSSDAKAFYGLVVTRVPYRFAGLESLDCFDCDAFGGHVSRQF